LGYLAVGITANTRRVSFKVNNG